MSSLLQQALANTTASALIDLFGPEQLAELMLDWRVVRRENQTPPLGWGKDYYIWLLLGGRGAGKTRVGAESCIEIARDADFAQGLLIAPTSNDLKKIMIHGPGSGIMECAPDEFRPVYHKQDMILEFPNGFKYVCISAEEPDRARGLQSCAIWMDEFSSYSYPDELWSNVMYGFRQGSRPRCVITTTPRPGKLLKSLYDRDGKDVRVTESITDDNFANLSDAFINTIIATFSGTRLEQQERYAKILSDVEGSLVARTMLKRGLAPQDIQRIVVGIDPAVTNKEDSDETGIVVDGLGPDERGYLLEDLTMKGTPDAWARRAVDAYHRWNADCIIAEVNNGGDMVEHTIRQIDRNVRFKAVRATRGKHVRFEPIAALYEQGRVVHCVQSPKLEDQVCSFTAYGYGGSDSPDRADAHVWCLTDLIVDRPVPFKVWL